MFSKRVVIIVGVLILLAANMIALTISSKNRSSTRGFGRVIISLVAPFQEIITHTIHSTRDVWSHYFSLASAARERDLLRDSLAQSLEKANHYRELELANVRLRELLHFKQSMAHTILAAEVIGRDPSPWFKSVTINKGRLEGIRRGLPVVVPAGIVGQVIEVANHYSKVLLIIDQNSSVDALVQRTRARGVVKGKSSRECILQYALRKLEIASGDTIVSSGLDGVYPKGLSIGSVSRVVRQSAGIFQDVTVSPFVDFDKLEEVLIILRVAYGDMRDGP